MQIDTEEHWTKKTLESDCSYCLQHNGHPYKALRLLNLKYFGKNSTTDINSFYHLIVVCKNG